MLRTIFDPYSDLFLEYIETTKKNDMQTNHYHDTYELFFVVKGIRYIFLDGVCHVLNPGDIILIKPYQTHYMQSLSSDFYARYVLNFAPDYLDGMLKPAEKQRFLEVLQNDILHLTTEQSGELVEVFERLLYEAGADTDAGALRSSQTGDSGCHRLYQCPLCGKNRSGDHRIPDPFK